MIKMKSQHVIDVCNVVVDWCKEKLDQEEAKLEYRRFEFFEEYRSIKTFLFNRQKYTEDDIEYMWKRGYSNFDYLGERATQEYAHIQYNKARTHELNILKSLAKTSINHDGGELWVDEKWVWVFTTYDRLIELKEQG